MCLYLMLHIIFQHNADVYCVTLPVQALKFRFSDGNLIFLTLSTHTLITNYILARQAFNVISKVRLWGFILYTDT